MTLHTLATAFTRLHAAIVHSRAVAVLEPMRPHATKPKPDVETLLTVFAAMSPGQTQFNEAEHALLTAFGLQAVTDTAWWAAVITACSRPGLSDQAASMVDGVHTRLQVAAETFPALARLIDATVATPALELEGIALLLPGLGGAPPALARVSSTIEAMNQLWTVAEDLTGQRGALHLVGMVPGPTMALHFDGLAEPLAELRALLVSIWEQTARLPRIPARQQPALVPDMLPVMERIGQSGRSDALRVRSAVEDGVRRLLEAGCTLPAATQPAAAVPVTARAKPTAVTVLAEDDISHLAAVIAEERSQLVRAEPARRLWQGASASQSA